MEVEEEVVEVEVVVVVVCDLLFSITAYRYFV